MDGRVTLPMSSSMAMAFTTLLAPSRRSKMTASVTSRSFFNCLPDMYTDSRGRRRRSGGGCMMRKLGSTSSFFVAFLVLVSSSSRPRPSPLRRSYRRPKSLAFWSSEGFSSTCLSSRRRHGPTRGGHRGGPGPAGAGPPSTSALRS